MPFNFRLGKRSQQYNVANKDLFVIAIELLTNECIECTLLASSTGQECLHNVCQKIGIQQPEYFSLLFRSKKNVDQWVDLNRPLKKQLAKYAAESRLYFRLQYFVPNFHFLSDEVSRYHYFCAMKNLVIDGRIACSRDDAILLASFSLQAEFGDYSPERHTVEYFNNFSLFPKAMVTNAIARDVLIECAINAYRNLQGVPHSVAEIYYISEAQRREGYGQEGFPARDLSTGQDVCLGVCIRGIFVVNCHNSTLELFKWMDIANLMHNKKVFTIERYSDKYSKNYSTYDNEYAGCIWHTCVEQHQYFMKGIQAAAAASAAAAAATTTTTTSTSTDTVVESTPDLVPSGLSFIRGADLFGGSGADNAATAAPLQSLYETINQDPKNHSTPIAGMADPDGYGQNPVVRQRSSTEPIDLHHITISCANNYNLQSGERITNSETANTVALTQSEPEPGCIIYANQTNVSDLSLEQKKKLLPPYRNPPDYETFVKQKYLAHSMSQSLSSIPSRLASHNPLAMMINSSSSSSSLVHSGMMPANMVSSSAVSVPQLLHQRVGKPVVTPLAGAVYRNYYDLSNLNVDKSSIMIPGVASNAGNHRCSLPPPTDSVAINQRLLKSGLITASSPDLNSNLLYRKNMQSKGNGQVTADSNGAIHLRPQIKTAAHFTSVPDLTYKNIPNGSDRKFKSKNCFSFGSKNFRFFWPHSKTGSEPNLFNGTSPNCYNLKRSKFSVERLDAHQQQHDTAAPARPSISYTIDELPETSPEQSRSEESHLLPSAERALKPNNQVIYINVSAEEGGGDKPDPPPKASFRSSRIIVFDKSFDDQDFTKEFELLPRMNPTAKFTTASLPENILRNRFRDILPYEENRVKLSPTKENKHGYINASHVLMAFGSMKQHYIAAQGPLPNTTLDFWQMVFEYHINLVVMVTNFSESGSQKCYTYLPLSCEPGKNTARFGDYEITCHGTCVTETYVSSALILSHNGQKRNITHLRYTDWNDHSIPGDMASFLTFLTVMDAIYRQNNREQLAAVGKKRTLAVGPPPILVHCSAGAGRSGVVILCDALLKCLDHNFESIDIPKALIQLRFQRMISVQHCEQFRFVCQVLSQYLSDSRLI